MLLGIYKALLPVVCSTKKTGVFIVVLTMLFHTVLPALPGPGLEPLLVNAVIRHLTSPSLTELTAVCKRNLESDCLVCSLLVLATLVVNLALVL